MEDFLKPIELKSKAISLLPLRATHEDGLITAAKDGALWNLWFTSVPKPENTSNYIDTALAEQKAGKSLAFAVRNNQTSTIIGCTRFCNVDDHNRRVEIGYTWYGKSHQKTGVNTACKYLMLQHAFEQLKCIAVAFRTNSHNHPSINAILRLGAKQDGILRNHRIDQDGCLRDTVVFSIIESEWPTVKKGLLHKMNQY